MSDTRFIITPVELQERIGSVCLLDVREPSEFHEIHIPGCVHIPLGELGARATAELDPVADIVVYCAHGVRSMQATMLLKSLGFEKVRSLEGGIAAWHGEKRGVA